ncbi:Leucine-rich repeat serine/threonine-protein kinase 2 [Mortierella sp. AD094]|nr:Leucine-rich repeat serine/threonine-protein kinase 2 [Mortierella sp. AD094]
MTEIFVPNEETPNYPYPCSNSTQLPPRDPTATVFVPDVDGWVDFNSKTREGMNNSGDNDISSSRVTAATRPLPKVIQGRKVSSPPMSHQATSRRNTESDLSSLPIPFSHFTPADNICPLSIPPPITLSLTSPASNSNSSAPRRSLASDSFGKLTMTKNKESTINVVPLNSNASTIPNTTEAGDDVMDIESCIDDPILAPLGRHVNKKRSSRRVDKGHIDINVVRPTSPATFIKEQEREPHSPVTSLILRRRRLDCVQLENYFQNLQPTLDPHTMCTLQSPLLHLTELDLSRNRLSSLPADMTSLVPFLYYLNLSHNQFTEVPMELCKLAHLQVLIMSQNRIEGPFPHQLCSSLSQLKTLKLCSNQITSLPHTLARLDKLESLSMGSVYGGNLLASFPSNCIQYMTALRELDLSHNKICFLPADIGHLHSHLRQLVVSDNKLEAIPKSIGLCKELRNLNLGRNQLTSLPTEIADLKQLDTLDLSENLLCVIPGDVADFLTKTTLLLTGNPFTRGYCDANRNPVSEIGGLGINYPSDEERYAAVLKNLSRRAILNAAASSSSSGSHTPTLGSLATGRESRRHSVTGESSYEMDQDERLDYHLYYTRHTLSSRPPSRAESVSSLNEHGGGGSDHGSLYGGSWNDPYGGGTGPSTPRVNVEAVLSDIDSFFDYIPSLNTTSTMATISSNTTMSEPSIFESASISSPTTLTPTMPTSPTFLPTPQIPSPAIEPDSTANSIDQSPITIQSQSFFPSLKELAARAVLHTGEPLPIELVPEAVIDYLEPGARPCALCRRPYVKEWVSSVRVKSYQGHPAVARRVRFCSVACWKTAGEQLEAEESRGVGPSIGIPGATTGHLPPVTMRTDCNGATSGIEGDISLLTLDSALAGTRILDIRSDHP